MGLLKSSSDLSAFSVRALFTQPGRVLVLLSAGLSIGSPIRAEEKPAAHDLGVTADPPAESAVIWKAKTSLRNGEFRGMVQGKPGESRIETLESRELKTIYVSASEREVTVVASQTTQSETIDGKEQKTETVSLLAGQPLRARLRDARWVLEVPDASQPTAQHRAELQKLEVRLNAPPNLFDGIKARVGESFFVDPLRFVKQAGFADAIRASGKVEGTIREVIERSGETAAVINLTVAAQATLQDASGPRRSLALDGQAAFVHSLKTGLDFSVELSAKLKTSGLMLVGPGSFAPFAFDAELKFDSTREYAKP